MRIAMVLFLFLGACSSGKPVVQERPVVREAVKVSPGTPVSPAQESFKSAYQELVCRANLDYDPLNDMAIIHEPVQFLSNLWENEDMRQKYYLAILNRWGYDNAGAYLGAYESLRVSSPNFVTAVKAALPEMLDRCKK